MRPPSNTFLRSSTLFSPSARPLGPYFLLTSSRPVLRPSRLRSLTTSSLHRSPLSSPPTTTNRGPPSTETTQTDFGTMDVLGSTPPPSTAIDACLSDGFHLDNGVKIGGGSGCLLVGGEAFAWRPWAASRAGAEGQKGSKLVNQKGQWDVGEGAWGVLELVWPKPGRDPSSCETLLQSDADRPYRSTYSRPRTAYVTNLTGDQEVYQFSWDQDRCPGYEKRGFTVQPFGDRERGAGGCGCLGTDWMEGAESLRRKKNQRTPIVARKKKNEASSGQHEWIQTTSPASAISI